MLTGIDSGGLGFKPEFVASVVRTRLELVVFGSREGEVTASVGQYQPASIFDFGPERASVTLGSFRAQRAEVHTYPTTGRAASPLGADLDAPFSFLRGYTSNADPLGLLYTMPNGMLTPCLPERFRQFLRTRTPDAQWYALESDTPLATLPPAMMFCVGLQFGQINVGTWNSFTLAAKRYFALQNCSSQDEINSRFFWQGTAPNFAADHNVLPLEAFGPLIEELGLHQRPAAVAAQFETALCSYYAMNMEILSRVSFEGNDPENCRMNAVFRLEGLEALEPMGMVTTSDEGSTYADVGKSGQPLGVPASSRRSVIDSSSATMFTRSVDKAVAFPPPVKVITQYSNVSHARILGHHLFNVDYSGARRDLPDVLLGKPKRTEYAAGCPFYKDPQREFLLMPTGLHADMCGVLALAPQDGVCFVLTCYEFPGERVLFSEEYFRDMLLKLIKG
jgi:hypothetical protein